MLTFDASSLTEELKRIREGGATVQQQSFGGPVGFRDLIQKAGWGPGVLGGMGGGFGGGGGSGHGGAGGGGGGGVGGSGGGVSDNGPRLKGQGAVSRDQGGREQRAMARLIAHGWTPEAAASAVGQAVEESRVHSNGARGDNGTAHGLFQWRLERFAALKAFAARRDKPWTDFDTQIDFFNEERKTRLRAERNWHTVKDVNSGNVIGKMFERYAGGLQHRRAAHALRVLNDWNRGAKPAVETEASGSAAPTSPRPSDLTEFRAWRERMAREGKAPLEEEDDARVFGQWQQRRKGSLLKGAQRAGVLGGAGDGTLNGKVDVTLTLPPGVEAKTAKEGIVSAVKLNRGSSMATSQSE